MKLTRFSSSGVWGGRLSRILGGEAGAPDLQRPQYSSGKVPLHPAAGEHVLDCHHGDVGVVYNRCGHLLLRVTANVPWHIPPVFPLIIINIGFLSASRTFLIKLLVTRRVIGCFVCFQETMLGELFSPCKSSWTQLLASTLNYSKCSSGSVLCFLITIGGHGKGRSGVYSQMWLRVS